MWFHFAELLSRQIKINLSSVLSFARPVRRPILQLYFLLLFSLFVPMFLCSDQCTTTSDSEFKEFNDVLLLSVDDTEFNKAQNILENVEIPSKKDKSDKNCCFGEIGRNKVTLLKVPYIGKTGTSSGHDVLVYETIQELKPKAIVSLGVCDGIRKEEHFLGDVVVSSQVYFLEQEEDGLSNFDRTTYDCDLGLVHLFNRGRFAWVGPCENVVVPKVHVGQLTTGLQDGDDKKRDSHKAGTIGIDKAAKSRYTNANDRNNFLVKQEK
jgi:hypothetical protein